MLQLLAMKVPNVLTFDFMSKPSPGEWNLQWSGRLQIDKQQQMDSQKSILEVSFGLVWWGTMKDRLGANSTIPAQRVASELYFCQQKD